MRRRSILTAIVTAIIAGLTSVAHGQITVPRKLSSTTRSIATLEELLVNRLRATSDQQKAYIKFILTKVKAGKLDPKLVVALQRKAVARNRNLPFPAFERSLRYEAAKRNLILPPLQHFATTKIVPQSPTP